MTAAGRPGPVGGSVPLVPARGPRTRERTADRRVTAAGIVAAGVFLLLAALASILPPETRLGSWLPLHLVLAGAASQAIGAALPFFTASLLAARPPSWVLRATTLALLGAGALAVTAGVAGHASGVAAAGGAAFVVGIGCLAAATFLPMRATLGRRHPWVLAAYAAALADVAIGASLATLQVAGVAPVVERWAWLKPAHAWLNLLGFVSLVIAGTLVHLYPTVVGSRIAAGRPLRVAVAGLSLGAPVVALGYGVDNDWVARAGGAAELAGVAGLLAYVWGAWAARGRWTGSLSWRRVSIVGLTCAVGWFAVGSTAAAVRVLADGSSPDGWTLAVVGAPLAAGWAAQSVVSAWTHLVPAISGGSPRRHERQREILGFASVARILAMNGGVALLSAGLAVSSPWLTAAGAVGVAVALAAALVTLAASLTAPEPPPG